MWNLERNLAEPWRGVRAFCEGARHGALQRPLCVPAQRLQEGGTLGVEGSFSFRLENGEFALR